jgi:hypothetical protein
MCERDIKWHIPEERSHVQAIADEALRELTRDAKRLKVVLRAHVRHAFHVVKNLSCYPKVPYQEPEDSTNQLHMLFCLHHTVSMCCAHRRWPDPGAGLPGVRAH